MGNKSVSETADESGLTINLLLTECEGRAGEYWPEVVVARSIQNRPRAN